MLKTTHSRLLRCSCSLGYECFIFHGIRFVSIISEPDRYFDQMRYADRTTDKKKCLKVVSRIGAVDKKCGSQV